MTIITEELATIDGMDVEGRRVLLRADFSVPLTRASPGERVRVADDTLIRAALPTIEELRRRGARLVLLSHLQSPRGRDAALSMRPVAARLATLTGAPVPLAPAVIGPQVRQLTEQLAPGSMLMLENVRFEAGEMRNDRELASALAELADLYVDDAFGAAHRTYASTEAIAHLVPCAAGRLMEREVRALTAVVDTPDRPLVAVLGGAKVAAKIGVVHRFLEVADVVCIGGALCFPFLAELGHGVGRSLCRHEDREPARLALVAAAGSRRLELPRDLRLASWGEEEKGIVIRPRAGVDVPDDCTALDIGLWTAERYAREISVAGTVFWSGPMGRCELAPFVAGTRRIATAVASTPATTVVGGGETVRALRSCGLQNRVSHVSTGDGAMLAFLEGRELPGVRALMRPLRLPRITQRVTTTHAPVGHAAGDVPHLHDAAGAGARRRPGRARRP